MLEELDNYLHIGCKERFTQSFMIWFRLKDGFILKFLDMIGF